MANKRKFGALANFRQEIIEDEPEETLLPKASAPTPATAPPRQVAEPEPARGRGRPPGKRSNPEWKLYSHFLKKQTQRRAAARVAELEDGRDLSDVLQEMLEQWLAAKRH